MSFYYSNYLYAIIITRARLRRAAAVLGFYTFAGPWVIEFSQALGNEINQGPYYVKNESKFFFETNRTKIDCLAWPLQKFLKWNSFDIHLSHLKPYFQLL